MSDTLSHGQRPGSIVLGPDGIFRIRFPDGRLEPLVPPWEGVMGRIVKACEYKSSILLSGN